MAAHPLPSSSQAIKTSKHTTHLSSTAKDHNAAQPHPTENTNDSRDDQLPPPPAPILKLPNELIADILDEVFMDTTRHPLDRSMVFPVPPILRTCHRLRHEGLKVWRTHLKAQWWLCRHHKILDLGSAMRVRKMRVEMAASDPEYWTKILDDRAANVWMLWTHALVSMGLTDLEMAKWRSPMFEWRE